MPRLNAHAQRKAKAQLSRGCLFHQTAASSNFQMASPIFWSSVSSLYTPKNIKSLYYCIFDVVHDCTLLRASDLILSSPHKWVIALSPPKGGLKQPSLLGGFVFWTPKRGLTRPTQDEGSKAPPQNPRRRGPVAVVRGIPVVHCSCSSISKLAWTTVLLRPCLESDSERERGRDKVCRQRKHVEA
jgi:hypothetical protein